jgi:hypothetical protein
MRREQRVADRDPSSGTRESTRSPAISNTMRRASE